MNKILVSKNRSKITGKFLPYRFSLTFTLHISCCSSRSQSLFLHSHPTTHSSTFENMHLLNCFFFLLPFFAPPKSLAPHSCSQQHPFSQPQPRSWTATSDRYVCLKLSPTSKAAVNDSALLQILQFLFPASFIAWFLTTSHVILLLHSHTLIPLFGSVIRADFNWKTPQQISLHLLASSIRVNKFLTFPPSSQ